MKIQSILNFMLCAVFMPIGLVQSATITVNGTNGAVTFDGVCSISEAILAANLDTEFNDCPAGSSGTDTIQLSTNITFTSAYETDPTYGSTGTPTITSPIIIDGMGFSISRDANLNCNLDEMNEASEFRLVLVNASGDLTLNNITMSEGCADGAGFARSGGAIRNDGSLSIQNSIISENSAVLSGAGVINTGTITTIQYSTFSKNSSNIGGGIRNLGSINTIQNSTFSENSAGTFGGGINNEDSITTIENTTFSANIANFEGGGIDNVGTINIVQNSTFSGNSATNTGSGISNFNGTTSTLSNSLFHNNIGGGNECSIAGTGSINGDNNLSDDLTSDCPDVSTTLTSSTIGPLTDNGGTTMTHALLSGSEAVDAGNIDSTATDQRGFAAFGIRDIGSFELSPIISCPTALQFDGFTTTVADSAELNQAIECANFNGNANGGDTINLSANITLNTAFENNDFGSTGIPAIDSSITIEGMGYKIERDSNLSCVLNSNNESDEFRILRITLSGDLTLNNTTLSNGCADGTGNGRNGAAIRNFGVLSILNSSLSNNTANLYGGGIFNKGTITSIQNSIFLSNSTDNQGGGIYNDNTITSIQNSTFSQNSAANTGGGIYNQDTLTTLQNNTFFGNTAVSNGAGIRNVDGSIVTLSNSLFNQNTGGGSECSHSGTGSIGGSNNLSDNVASNCPDASTLNSSTIAPLADNGGPTMTHALLPGSQAIDAGDGDSITTDQRGINAFGPRDIGAYEATALEELCTIALQSDGFTTSVANPTELNQAINCANLNGNQTDSINLSTDITLSQAFEEDANFGSTGTPSITNPIILDGMGHSIARDDTLNCIINNVNDASEFRILRISSLGNLTLNNITLTNGCANGSGFNGINEGGAIYNNGLLSLENSIFSENNAIFAGGIANRGSIANIQNSTFTENSSQILGGAIENNGTITTIQDSTFFGNLTGSLGGGIHNFSGTITNILNSNFSNNSANEGGGIANENMISTIRNSTFSGNSSVFLGGGIYNSDTITSIENNTFSDNTAEDNGAGISNINGSIVTLSNSLFNQNTGGGSECFHSGTGSINGSNNLSDNVASSCPDTSTLNSSTIGPLADNGGPTMTHALLLGSQAIDAGDGNSTTTDQRGTNAFGPRDIGAYEATTLEELCTIALQSDGFTTSVANPTELNQAINCANLNGMSTDTINLSQDITLTKTFDENIVFGSTGTPVITSPIIIDGMSFSILRDGVCTLDTTNSASEYRLLRIDITGELTINNITLSNGCANGIVTAGDGGAIISFGLLSINNSTISENKAEFGGGLSNFRTIFIIQNSTFIGNSSGTFGGGIHNRNSINTIQNTTFSANSSDNGGGIHNGGNIDTIQNITISDNSANNTGAGIRNSGTITTFRNSLFNQNTGMGNECSNSSSSSIGGSNNLSDNAASDCSGLLPTTLTPSTLGPLADNGGPTMTHALLSGSEAIDTGDGDSIATDQRGYTASNIRDIGAFESFVPVVTAPMDVTVEATGLQTSPPLGTASVSDSDETNALTAIANQTSDFVIGMTTVTWSATDSYGLIGSDTQIVTIVDTTDPIITAPIDISIEATGPLTPVKLGTATAIDLVDGALSPTADNSGPFPVGETIVTWSSTDAQGNTGTAIQLVTIIDSEAPVVTAPEDITSEATGILTIVDLGTATANDIADGELTATSDAPDSFPLGETIVTWSATDSQMLTSTATQLVTIVDTSAPVITLTGANPQLIQETEDYIELGASATDLVDDDTALTAAIVIDDSDVNTDVPGMYEVTYNVIDAAGNIANTMVRDVEVTADIPVTMNDSYNTNEDTVLTSQNSVLTNDNDPDNEELTVVNTGTSTMIGMGGSINIAANGTFTYTPVANVSGTDVLNYEITDGTHTVSSTITIVVNPVNDAPTFTVMDDVDVTGLVDMMNDFVEVPGFIENIVFGPADESGQSIDSITAVAVDPDNVINAVTIDNNGLLRIDINIGNYGAAIVQVQLKDDGGIANSGEDTSQIVEFMVIYDDLIFGNGFESNID